MEAVEFSGNVFVNVTIARAGYGVDRALSSLEAARWHLGCVPLIAHPSISVCGQGWGHWTDSIGPGLDLSIVCGGSLGFRHRRCFGLFLLVWYWHGWSVGLFNAPENNDTR